MQKIRTFLRYVTDYLKFGEFYFLWTSIQYVITKKVNPPVRIYKSSLGIFETRKGTLDFQFLNYAYEWNVKRFVLQYYKDYNLFLDIGANVGTYSFLLARKGKVCHAFEPMKENCESIFRNIVRNGLEKMITAHQYGLGSKNSEEDFIFESKNTGASHLASIHTSYVETKGEVGTRVKADIKTLDLVISTINYTKDDKILLKIDAEGMEIDILEGGKEFIRNHPHFLIVMESKHSGAEKIKEYLKSVGNFIYLEVDDENMAIMK
ncbi:MAG: FkbM family methyltransferase [Bacteroidetes bacterium]|nr:FkbM family methyltransferase [Bacteroidota bacterium]